ncbi:MAG TPA: metallophosphoesterase, partial [Holophagaceae bacterium]|nr:metallophosphoesterase [Holophagaceae bacterium]
MDRKDFLRLMGLGGVVFASGLDGFAAPARAASLALSTKDFHFVQLTDTHWGFSGAPNPDAAGTLPKAIEAVNNLQRQPDFIIFTGDLTHTTEDAK